MNIWVEPLPHEMQMPNGQTISGLMTSETKANQISSSADIRNKIYWKIHATNFYKRSKLISDLIRLPCVEEGLLDNVNYRDIRLAIQYRLIFLNPTGLWCREPDRSKCRTTGVCGTNCIQTQPCIQSNPVLSSRVPLLAPRSVCNLGHVQFKMNSI